ncbi:hypothetical protein DOTSEDRAFT_70012 [Dothistroma septosporum NZE10]|uniref:Uncharacterized protein n=1 Tax=Dothistroma septosporum (strain NZE10 / CBS 128990) TaxID=675120 RepID=N1PXJ5_DOTSN|nr:hypothetical protein DOTSEDRAFT_70012 [Dothistroma septosporum NZE10]
METHNASIPHNCENMTDRARKKAMHTPRLHKQAQAVTRNRKSGLQPHSRTPSHASTTNSYLDSVSYSSQRSSATPPCKSVAARDGNADALQDRRIGTSTRDRQAVTTARRDDVLQYVNAVYDRQDILEQENDEKAARIRELEAAQGTMSNANNNHTSRISDLEREIGRLKDRKGQFKLENRRLRSERATSQKTVAAYEANLAAVIAEKKDLVQQQSELESRLAAAEQKAEEARRLEDCASDEQIQLRAKIDGLQQGNMILESRAQMCEKEKAALVASLAVSKQQSLKKVDDIQALRTANASLLQNDRTLAPKNRDIHQQNCELMKDIESLQAELASRNTGPSNIDALTDEVEFLRDANTTLQDRLAAVRHAQTTQRRVIEHLHLHNDELLTKKHDTDGELESLRLLQEEDDTDAAALRDKLEEQQARIDDFNKDLGTITELRQQNKMAENKATTNAAELKTLQQVTTDQAATIAKLKSDRDKFQQENAEAVRCITRSAKEKCELLARLNTVDRARTELSELLYAQLERLRAFDEDNTYVDANTSELAKTDAAVRRAENVDLRAQQGKAVEVLQYRNEEIRHLKAKLNSIETELASLEDELVPTKRDLAQTQASLEICKDQKNRVITNFDVCEYEKGELVGDLDACKQRLKSADKEIESMRSQNSHVHGELAQVQSGTRILAKALADSRVELEAARTAELAIKQDMDNLKASRTVQPRINASQATHGERRYTSQKYVQQDVYGIEIPNSRKKLVTPLGEQYWESMQHFYQEVPDYRVKISINNRVLPRRIQRLCYGGIDPRTQPTTQEPLPFTADKMEADQLVETLWTLTAIDTDGLELIKPSAGDLVDDLLRPTISRGAGLDRFEQEATQIPPKLCSEQNVMQTSRSSLLQGPAILTTDSEEADEDSLFVPEVPAAQNDNGSRSGEWPHNASMQRLELNTEQARSNSVLKKQAQFVPPPAVMSRPESAQIPLSEAPRPDYTTRDGANPICTDVTSTARVQSLPYSLPLSGDTRPSKSVQWAEQTARPVSPLRESTMDSPSLKRQASTSDGPARPSKKLRISHPGQQQHGTHRRESISGAAPQPSTVTHRRAVRCG